MERMNFQIPPKFKYVMKKLLSLIFFSTILFTLVYSQDKINYEFQSGDCKTLMKGSVEPDFLGYCDGNFYMAHWNKRYMVGEDFSLKKVYKIKRSEEEKLRMKNSVIFNVVIGAEIYEITTNFDKDEMKGYYYAQTIDKESLALQDDRKQILEFDIMNEGVRPYNILYDYIFSPDKSKYFIYNINPYDSKHILFSWSVLDLEMNILETSQIDYTIEGEIEDNINNATWKSIPTTSFNKRPVELAMPILDIFIDNDGAVYITSIVHSGGDDGSTLLNIAKYGVGPEQVFEIFLDDKRIKKIASKVDNEGNIHGFGTYVEDVNNDIDGIFYFKLDAKTKEIIEETYYEYEPSEQRELGGYTTPDYSDVLIKDLIILDDGRIIFLFEPCEYYWVVAEYTNYYDFHLGSINIAIKSPDGKLNVYEVPKFQDFSLENSSFITEVVGDDIYFVFNDLSFGKYSKISSSYERIVSSKIVKLDKHGNIYEDVIPLTGKGYFRYLRIANSIKMEDGRLW